MTDILVLHKIIIRAFKVQFIKYKWERMLSYYKEDGSLKKITD